MQEQSRGKSGLTRPLLLGGLLLLVVFWDQLAYAEDLGEIFELAAANDPQVREARARYESTHTQISQARSALLPTVTLQGSAARNAQAPSAQFSYANGFNSHGWGLNLSQNLLNFEAWYAFQSAQESDRVAATNLAIAEQNLILRVSTAYFDVMRSLDNLAAFEAEEAASSQVLEQAEQSFEVGLNTITDVFQSQSNYDLARVNTLVERNNLAQRLEVLEAITGSSHTDLEMLQDTFPIESVEPVEMSAWEELAREQNLSVLAAQYDYQARQQDVKSARAAAYPRFDISAGYNYNAESANPFSFFENTAAERTNISVNVTIPLYSGGLNRARRRQAYHNRNASEEALLFTRRSAVQDVRNAFRSVETDVLTVTARQQAIVSATSSLQATETGAEVGTRNTVDVVLAQRTLYQAIRDHANARYDYVIDILNLKQAAGTLNPQDIYDLNAWLQ